MFVDLPESPSPYRSKSKRKTLVKDSRRSSPKKKSKSPKKGSKLTSHKLNEYENEDFQMSLDSKTAQERKALENLRSLADDFDSGFVEKEREIQKWTTTNVQVDLFYSKTRRERIRTTSNVLEKIRSEAESELDKSKANMIRLPMISVLKKTFEYEDYDFHQPTEQSSNRLLCHTEPDKILDNNDHSYLKTYRDFSQLLKKPIRENTSNKAAVMTERPKSPLEEERQARSQRKSTKIVTKQHEEKHETESSSVNKMQVVNKSITKQWTTVKEELQPAKVNTPGIFAKQAMAIRGLRRQEKTSQESLSLTKDNAATMECVQNLQQEIISHFSFQPKNSIKGYLNLSKEELQDEEEKIAQSVGVKLVQLRRDNLAVQSGRINTDTQDEINTERQLRRTMHSRPKIKPRSIDKAVEKDRDISATKDLKIDEVKERKKTPERKQTPEQKDVNKDNQYITQNRFKVPILSDMRENILMQGFNIFKSSSQNQGLKEKVTECSSPVAMSPKTTRNPEAELKKTQIMTHSRSNSSRFRTKIISKGSPLLFIMGSEKEASFKRQMGSKNLEAPNFKNLFPAPPPFMTEESELQDQAAQRMKNTFFEYNRPTPSFEPKRFDHKRMLIPLDYSNIEKEAKDTSYLIEAKKEKDRMYIPRRAMGHTGFFDRV